MYKCDCRFFAKGHLFDSQGTRVQSKYNLASPIASMSKGYAVFSVDIACCTFICFVKFAADLTYFSQIWHNLPVDCCGSFFVKRVFDCLQSWESHAHTNIYSHPQTDCFVLSELFSVARHAGRSEPGSKPVQLYVRLWFRPLVHQADHVGQGNF